MPIHIIAALMLCIGTPATAVPLSVRPMTTTPDSITRFSRIEGTNLEGRRFVMPNDFTGDVNVILIAFKREQQKDVDTWTPFLNRLSAERADVRVYELPVINRHYRIMRRIIDGGMARGIADQATRAATITLYIDKDPFKAALDITTENIIVVLFVTRDGRILARVDGAYSAAAAEPLTHIGIGA